MFQEELRERVAQHAVLERHSQQKTFRLIDYFSYESYFLQTNKFSNVITFHTKVESPVYVNSNTTSIRRDGWHRVRFVPPVYVFV